MTTFVRALSTVLCLLYGCSILAQGAIPSDLAKPKIAIVIDDLGYNLDAARWLAHQPFPITLAVIPNAPYAQRISQMSETQQQELILHVPMEPEAAQNWEDGLTTTMEKDALQSRLSEMLSAFPAAVGINNHGGSRFTKDQQRMQWVMAPLKEEKLFFLDSRTTSESQAEAAAEQSKADIAVRDIFLDHEIDTEQIVQQFQKLRRIAKSKGQAIAIGHPHPETLEILAQEMPKLIEEGFHLTFCSQLIEKQEKMASK